MTHSQQLVAQNLKYLTNSRHVPLGAVLAVQAAVILSKWATRRRTRLALSQLSDAQLEDVGLTPAEASREARRAFWQA